MRPVREIAAEEENFRVEPHPDFPTVHVIRREPVEPEPVGTIVMCAFRIVGYDPDCDGSLTARMENIDADGEMTGWEARNQGLHPDSNLVVTMDELKQLFSGGETSIVDMAARIKRLEDRLASMDMPHSDRTCECCEMPYIPRSYDSVRCNLCCMTCLKPDVESAWIPGALCPRNKIRTTYD